MIDGGTKLKVRSEFEVIPLEGEDVLVRSPEQGVRVRVDGLQGVELAALLAALDGSRTLGSVAHGPSSTGLGSLLAGLVARDIVEVEPGAGPRSDEERVFAHYHEDPAGCARRLAVSRVLIWGRNLLAQCVARDLRAAGVRDVTTLRTIAVASCRSADLVVICPDGVARTSAETGVSRAAARAGVAYLPVRIFGAQGYVGPLFVPGDGPCHVCLAGREEANWADPELTHAYLRRLAGSSAGDGYGRLPAFEPLVSQWTAVEATKYLARFTAPAILANVLRIDLLRTRMQLHRVLRLPRCEECSPVTRRPRVDATMHAGAQ